MRYVGKMKKMYSVILHYKGYVVCVENYIYKLKINPTQSFVTMTDIKNHIDKIENNENIVNRIGERPDCTDPLNEKFFE